ncbi:hypothetical protein C2845_PM13G05940 [Panicum miliaceum]|uniref:Uncharacterized protein n=1 Tax=Panicum miliaceum TaxID=4540 RepID=A0A3L6RHF6_PANMI|nr:hypothetical protein C2845_PM13G05940 [Panicum miliaceum]
MWPVLVGNDRVGFEDVSNPWVVDYGLRRFDHVVSNVPELVLVAAYVAGFMGFHEFAEFRAEDVSMAVQSRHHGVVPKPAAA